MEGPVNSPAQQKSSPNRLIDSALTIPPTGAPLRGAASIDDILDRRKSQAKRLRHVSSEYHAKAPGHFFSLVDALRRQNFAEFLRAHPLEGACLAYRHASSDESKLLPVILSL